MEAFIGFLFSMAMFFVFFYLLRAAYRALFVNPKNKFKDGKDQLETLNLSPTRYFESPLGGFIGLDEEKETFFVFDLQDRKSLVSFKFKEIIDCELILDGETVFKKSSGRTIGGALVGGVLLGGAGAIVGGLSGGGKSTVKTKEVKLRIIINDLNIPNVYFYFLRNLSIGSQQAIQTATEWKDIISIIIDRNQKSK